MFLVRFRKACLILSLLVGTVACDQVTKTVARDSIAVTGPHSYLGGTVRLEAAENPGAFMNLGQSWPSPWRFLFLQAGVLVTLAGVAFVLWRRAGSLALTVGLSLILAGGIGNLWDRLVKDSVTDFLIVGWGPLHTGIFNVADVAIVAGVLLIAFESYLSSAAKLKS